MKKKQSDLKNIALIFMAVFIIFGLIAVYKCLILSFFPPVYISHNVVNLKVTDTITIYHNNYNENEYMTFNNMKFKNEFKDFTLKEINADGFPSMSGFNGKASVSFGQTNSFINRFTKLKEGKIEFIAKKIINSRNIKTDLELFKFTEEHKNEHSNVFTNTHVIAENYAVQSFIEDLPDIDGITIIKGDYDGYILNIGNEVKEVFINKNGKTYFFTFVKTKYFTDDFIRNIIGSLVIEGE